MDGRQQYQDIQRPTASGGYAQSRQAQMQSSPYQQPAYEPTPPPSNYQHPQKGRGLKKALLVALVVVLLAATAGGVYVWQNGQVKDLTLKKDSLSRQVAELTVQNSASQADEAQNAAADTDQPDKVANGQATLSENGSDVIVQSYYLTSDSKIELTLKYGTDAKKLDQQTDTIVIKPDAANKEVMFDVHSWTLKGSDLEAGKGYFYQTVADIDGQTYSTGLAVFRIAK